MKKKTNIRAIDQGTMYDVTGRMRLLLRQIDRGEHGQVRNVVIIMEEVRPNGTSVDVRHFGNSPIATAHWMTATALNRMEPS